MSSQRSDTQQRITQLKRALGSWMFGILTQFTREQFLYACKNMQDDPKLEMFQSRVQNARTAFTVLQRLCSPKQLPYIGKPFFYGVQFQQTRTYCSDTGDEQIKSHVCLNLDSVRQNKKEITETINNEREYGLFTMAIADILNSNDDKFKEILEAVAYESNINDSALVEIKKEMEQLQAAKEEAKRRKEDEGIQAPENSVDVEYCANRIASGNSAAAEASKVFLEEELAKKGVQEDIASKRADAVIKRAFAV